jgi:hypothetical protein
MTPACTGDLAFAARSNDAAFCLAVLGFVLTS